MAPGLVDPSPAGTDSPVNKQLFPDGFKTSGQHEPIYSKIQPHESFPNEITGPTVWKREDYQHNPEKWQYSFTPSDIAELGATADAFMGSGKPLTAITKVRDMTCRQYGLTCVHRMYLNYLLLVQCWQSCATSWSTVRAFGCSRTSQSRNGVQTSAQQHTW